MYRVIRVSLLLLIAVSTVAQRSDSLFVEQTLQQAPANAGTLYFARLFLGRPYVAHTLEVGDVEHLVVNTRQLDCTTLVENVVALTLCARAGEHTYAAFCRQLMRLRYRQGVLDGYPSRLHYFSDWIADNQQMRIVHEIQQTSPPFTAVQTLHINYMSTHPHSYEALRRHPEFVEPIARQEHRLTGRRNRYIPKAEVKDTPVLRRCVHDGDIIAITCRKDGLDIAHLGFAVWRTDGLHLLNASQLHKKVIEEPMTLGVYLSKHPSHTGIRVVRLESCQSASGGVPPRTR